MANDIIVIDAADGAGKSTQINKLKSLYSEDFFSFYKFPNYKSETGFFVSCYLKGMFEHYKDEMDELEFIKKMSILYAMDRVQFFKTEFKRNLFNIFDRYTTSNILHMSSKFENKNYIEEYIDWLEDLEYNKLDIPRPDKIIYLDVPAEISYQNIIKRNETLDINESLQALQKVQDIKDYIIHRCKWTRINCYEKGKMRSIDEINRELQDNICKSNFVVLNKNIKN